MRVKKCPYCGKTENIDAEDAEKKVKLKLT